MFAMHGYVDIGTTYDVLGWSTVGQKYGATATWKRFFCVFFVTYRNCPLGGPKKNNKWALLASGRPKKQKHTKWTLLVKCAKRYVYNGLATLGLQNVTYTTVWRPGASKTLRKQLCYDFGLPKRYKNYCLATLGLQNVTKTIVWRPWAPKTLQK